MDTTPPEVDKATTPENVQDVETPDTATTPFMKVKYNKEEIELDENKTREYTQKGMNYDKVKNELEQSKKNFEDLQQNSSLAFLDRIAKDNGVSRADIVKQMEDEFNQSEIDKLVNDKDIDITFAKEVQTLKSDNKKNTAELTKYKQTEAQTKGLKDLQAQEYQAFHEAYPDVTNEQIPDEVVLEWNKKVPLLTAYVSYENKKLKDKISEFEETRRIESVNIDNADKSTGALGTGGGTQNELTQEIFDNMTPVQMESSMDEIIEKLASGVLHE